MLPVIVFTIITLIAFASNSVFARLALLDGAIDEASYTTVRLIAGAVMLALLIIVSRKQTLKTVIRGGNWISAAALFAYAVTLSFAYVGSKPALVH